MTSRAETDRVRRVVAPVVEDAGMYLEEVVVQRSSSRAVVRVVVDLAEDASGGVDLDTLGEMSRAVSEALDADDAVRGPYALEVTSPGTDRPLTEPRHFRRARGRLVELRLRDGSTVTGRVRDLEADELVLVVDSGPRGRRVSREHRVGLAQVDHGRVQVELTRAEPGTVHPQEAEPGDGDPHGDEDTQHGRATAGKQEQG